MKSTCYDVKTVFNGNCDVASESFKFPFEKVEIEYTTEKCQKLYGKKWNVPIGTVITLTRFFRKPIKIEDLSIDVSEDDYIKSSTDVMNQIAYERKGGGLE